MNRWDDLEENEYYREKFEPTETITIKNLNVELDFYSYKYLGTELAMYKIMDTNFVEYIEKRGDVTKLNQIYIPTGA
jgi:hypothetical protein